MSDNIASLAAARQTKTTARAARDGAAGPAVGEGDGEETRPVIRLLAGELSRVLDKLDAAFVEGDLAMYRQGGRLVRLVWEKILTAGGGQGDSLRLSTIGSAHLLERASLVARFEKWDGRIGDFVFCSCPEGVAESYIARDGDWKLPFILGVVTAPTLRPDGSVIFEAGYDKATGIVFNPLGVEYLKPIDVPTREDALEALALIMKLLREYPLVGPNLAVALSGIITTVIRRAMPTAPMHAFSASTAGSGKSMLVDIASIIATGNPASVTSTGRDKFGEAELEKRLTASMLGGDAVLSLDNLETPLGGELLCQLLTQTTVKLRPLGKSVNVETPVTTSFFATGNNLTVVGDLTRRVLVASFDVESERPELRQFDFNPMDEARAKRVELVQAVLTIVRAYLLSGAERVGSGLGSYEAWDKLVRQPLIWLGVGDPVGVMEGVRANDPRLAKLKGVVDAWGASFGAVKTSLADAVDAAMGQWDGGGGWKNPDLREALMAVAGDGRTISKEKLGWWMGKNMKRLVDGCRFVKDEGARKATYTLEGGQKAVSGQGLDGGFNPEDEIPF